MTSLHPDKWLGHHFIGRTSSGRRHRTLSQCKGVISGQGGGEHARNMMELTGFVGIENISRKLKRFDLSTFQCVQWSYCILVSAFRITIAMHMNWQYILKYRKIIIIIKKNI